MNTSNAGPPPDREARFRAVYEATYMDLVRFAQRRVHTQSRETWKDFDSELIARRLDLAAAWRRLAPVHQETLSLAIWDGLAGPQAAAVLGISPVVFRLRLTRARRALRRYCESAPAQPSPSPAVLREGISS